MRTAMWKVYGLFILLTEAVGALSGFLTKDGTKAYEMYAAKPVLTPPGSVFPIVWGILYALMGISAGKVWQASHSAERSRGLFLFGTQLVVNFCWS